MSATWIVAANASRARIFSQANASAPLEEVNDMVNASARLRMLETTASDKRGPASATRSIHNVGGATPNKLYEPPQTPDKHEAELFARDIVGYLQQAHREGRFRQLSLVASPQFLGMLRSLLDKELEFAVTMEINKDYTHSDGEQLRAQIQAHGPKG